MDINTALDILEIEKNAVITFEICKKSYRKLAMKYHPDRCATGSEIMKLLNEAINFLEKFDFTNFKDKRSEVNENNTIIEEINNFLNLIIHLEGLEIEICGVYVWIGGSTMKYKEILKEGGARWASRKCMWFFSSNKLTRTKKDMSINDIRTKFGSKKVFNTCKVKIAKKSI